MESLLQKMFTTSQFADIYGINKRTLMYYDEIGLFQPDYVGENGYRYYSFKQNLKFEAILLLRKLRVPLKEIKNYLDNYTQDKLLDLLYAQEQQLEMQIAELRRLKRIVRNRIDNIESNKKLDFAKIEVVQLDKKPIFLSESFDGKKGEQLLILISTFMKACYNSNAYSGHPIGVIVDVQKNDRPVTNGFYIVDEMCQQEVVLSYKPAGKYLVGYHLGDWRKIQQTYDKLIAYAKKNKLVFSNNAYEERLFDDVSKAENESSKYFEIKISILLK